MLLNQIIFVGGKGGVGKSTISSSLALHLSLKNKKTLLISTDPAHNLSDIFNLPYSQSSIWINPCLFLRQIDPKQEVITYTQNIAKDAKKLIGAHHYEMIDRYYKSASENGMTQESALFDSLVRIIALDQDQWDHIVIDTAPTGHTLRFFTLAQTLKTWSKTLLGYQKKNSYLYDILGSPSLENHSIIQRLEERYKLYHQFQSILTNPQKTSIIFTLNPDLLSINETKRALLELQRDKIHIYALAINKIFPSSSDSFLQKRYAIQAHYLEKIYQDFSAFIHWKIPYLDKDITKEEQILSLLSHISIS
ncbi:ArsA family ATPase [Helicobacter pametensis]|uniref:ArsA family ATPase n=1 Tax=Helicobacter pametensis TaxID=95149 RepID=UPI000484DC4F|nr:TRC40/GET3/ArsA family transport-energizing ATPase [Helicobacter pametensis]